VIEEEGTTAASKADRIASATKRTITERMDEDPAFYKQFSELLEETIRDYREKRISEKEYLNNVVDLASRMAKRDSGKDVPESIKSDADALAVFGIIEPILKTVGDGANDNTTADIARSIISIIRDHHIVDVWSNEVAQNNMCNAIDDYFFDVVRDEKGIEIPLDTLDDIELQIMDVARARFPG
jgi:type I restriction enzyme R subunit